MAGFQEFAKSSSKIALAIFLAFCGIGLVSTLGYWGFESYKANQAKQYEEVRDWEVDLTDNLKLTLKARTKLVSSSLLASVQFIGYPAYLSSPINQNSGFTLNFLDKDGFKLYSKTLHVNEFTSIVGVDGSKIGLDAQVKDYIDIDDYKNFAQLAVEWNLNTEAPKLSERKPEPIILDHCAPKISKAERLKRLAQHGTVRQTSSDSYYAGFHSVDFFSYDGSLLNCR